MKRRRGRLGTRALRFRPEVTSFLDAVVSGAHSDLALDEIPIAKASEFAGCTLRNADLRGRFGVLVVGIRDAHEAEFRYNPVPDDKLPGGGTVIALGSPAAI